MYSMFSYTLLLRFESPGLFHVQGYIHCPETHLLPTACTVLVMNEQVEANRSLWLAPEISSVRAWLPEMNQEADSGTKYEFIAAKLPLKRF